MNIVVLAGGLSHERDVSLASGSQIAKALRESGFKVLLLDLYEGISKNIDDYDKLFTGCEKESKMYEVANQEPDLEEIIRRNNNGDSLVGDNVIDLCKYSDIVFLALHGDIGENGKLQAMFDILGIKYTGTGYIGSLLAMDKDITKQLLVYAGVKTADWMIYKDGENIDDVNKRIGFPCVVKPCSSGSSVGVSIVEDINEFRNSISLAKAVEEEILIEKKITGREFSVGIIESEALPIIEIVPKKGFFDYKNKYQSGMTNDICPAKLSEKQTKTMQEEAIKVHKVLKLGSYSRIDFIMNEKDEIYCLEANTLPGMTRTSLLPQESKQAGIDYRQLCKKIIQISKNDLRIDKE